MFSGLRTLEFSGVCDGGVFTEYRSLTVLEYYAMHMAFPGSLSEKYAQVHCTVLILSWDGYADLWPPFFNLFWRYWPNCPYSVLLGSNQQHFAHPKVRMALAPQEGSVWTARTRRQLEQVTSRYVICILEDFFMQSAVAQEQVDYCLCALESLQGVMLRLIPNPPPDRPVLGWENIGSCDAGRPYRVSLQGTIWHRERLLSLLCDGESQWQFEEGASRRSGNSGGYYCVYRPVLTYRHHVVERGKWFRNEAKRFGAMNLGCDFSKRAVMTMREMAAWRYRKTIGQCRDAIPWRWRRALKRLTVKS